jgi:hypothetical protein
MEPTQARPVDNVMKALLVQLMTAENGDPGVCCVHAPLKWFYWMHCTMAVSKFLFG